MGLSGFDFKEGLPAPLLVLASLQDTPPPTILPIQKLLLLLFPSLLSPPLPFGPQ